MAVVDAVPEAQARDDTEHGGVEVAADGDGTLASGGQAGDEGLDGVLLQRREVSQARWVEGLGCEVAAESTPVRAVAHGEHTLAELATAAVGQSNEEGRERAVREVVRVFDERMVGDGGIADLQDGRSWRSTGSPATPDQDG
jgi:hypothetical protein